MPDDQAESSGTSHRPSYQIHVAKGNAPPGFMVRRSSYSAPYGIGESSLMRFATALPMVILWGKSIRSLSRSDRITSSREPKYVAWPRAGQRSG